MTSPAQRGPEPGVYDRLLRLESVGIRLGLERIAPLMAALGEPHRVARRTVIITGTNGKGSVAATVSAALTAAGLRVGLYTSPHLVSVLERIRIDDQDLGAAEFDALGEEVLSAIARTGTPASFFEALTAMAFLAFARHDVDVQILEVGVGGARDATRIAVPTHVVITQIALDHAALIGPGLKEIAVEKFGVTAPGSLNVMNVPPRFRDLAPKGWHLDSSGRSDPSSGVRYELLGARGDPNTRLSVVTPERTLLLPVPRLAGAHQLGNTALAVALLVHLGVSAEAIAAGITGIRWRARLERLPGQPLTILDGAHNPAGIQKLIASLPEVGLVPGFTLVFGAHPKKDAGPMLRRLASLAGSVVLTEAPLLRDANRLARLLPRHPDLQVIPDCSEAVRVARSLGRPVLIAGSLYLAGAVLRTLA
ncbi:MAG: bifunctional folylpolyglutamate synthase/dihydrofolate synthase [Myxococcales bacterium]|nr:bifunctional folylpolyglutamate synthase/dihydrofolate synthase [Myxococcales bacterium]